MITDWGPLAVCSVFDFGKTLTGMLSSRLIFARIFRLYIDV